MIATDPQAQARQAQAFYEESLRARLEAKHRDEFIAVEPQSGDYFLGKTSLEANLAATKAYPRRFCLVMRIGHPAAHHLGSGAR
jgi:hypothetical protein